MSEMITFDNLANYNVLFKTSSDFLDSVDKITGCKFAGKNHEFFSKLFTSTYILQLPSKEQLEEFLMAEMKEMGI